MSNMRAGDFFKRTLKTGFQGFRRNGIVSLAAVLMMTVTLSIVAFLLFLNAVLNFSVGQISERVDVTVFFYPEVTEVEISDFNQEVEKVDLVQETVYISRDEALTRFLDRHQGDTLTLQALEELGENPLGASLSIKASNPSDYEKIIGQLQSRGVLDLSSTDSIVERINYQQNKEILDRLHDTIATVQALGLGLTLFFMIISVLITFNTIRLAIYSSREEVEIMRLVGAENQYIRGPFVVQGIMYGFVSAVVTLAILYPATVWVSQKTAGFFGGMDVYLYYANNFTQLFVITVVLGVILGVIASLFAIRRYLRK